MARWRKWAQEGSLGRTALLVLTRRLGGYEDRPGVPAADLERERLQSQADLAKLSSAGRRILVDSGHDMQVEAPAAVSQAIEEVVAMVRRRDQAHERKPGRVTGLPSGNDALPGRLLP